MLSLPLFTVTNTVVSSLDDWEDLWRRRRAELVLTGITLEEHFQERVNTLDQLLIGLIDHFRRTELVSSAVLGSVAEVIEQIDTEFLGIEAWQQAEALPDRVRKLSSIETTRNTQLCLSALRKRIRLMQMLLPEFEKNRRLAFQFPETSEKLAITQDEVLELFRELRGHVGELVRHL